MTEKNLAQA